MFNKTTGENNPTTAMRKVFTEDKESMPLPDLIEVQKNSYKLPKIRYGN